MISMSSNLKQYLKDNRYCSWSVVIDFVDGRSVNLDGTDLPMGCGEITIGSGSENFPIGQCLSKTLNISIFNVDYQYDDFDFYGAVLNVYAEYDLSQYGGGTEKLHIGKFTVTEPEEYGTVISLVAYDDFYKTDKIADISVKGKTVKQIFQEACTDCGLLHSSTNYQYSDYVVTEELDAKYTYRQIIGLCAMICGGNAVVKDGIVNILTYSYIKEVMGDEADGGKFHKTTPYSSGDKLNGGAFKPWENTVVFDAGTFSNCEDVLQLTDAINKKMATDSVIITGVKLNSGDDEYTYGTDDYVISVENPLTNGNPQTAVNNIGYSVQNFKFRTCEVDIPSYPAIEICDQCYIVDHNGSYLSTFVTDLSIVINGYTTIKCSAKSPIRNANKYTSIQTETLQKAKSFVRQDILNHDSQISRIGDLIAKSMGLHLTMEYDGNGGNVYILHDKQTLSESRNVFLINSEGFFISNDGGETYVAGFDSSGNLVMNILSVVGISANWIRTGTLGVGGVDNTSGKINIYDEKGYQFGDITKDGMRLYNRPTISTGNMVKMGKDGFEFYSGYDYDNHIGRIGTGSVYSHEKSIAFKLDDPQSCIAWEYREGDTGAYTTKLVYTPNLIQHNSITLEEDTFHIYADFNHHNYEVRKVHVTDARYYGNQDFQTDIKMHRFNICDADLKSARFYSDDDIRTAVEFHTEVDFKKNEVTNGILKDMEYEGSHKFHSSIYFDRSAGIYNAVLKDGSAYNLLMYGSCKVNCDMDLMNNWIKNAKFVNNAYTGKIKCKAFSTSAKDYVDAVLYVENGMIKTTES